MAPFIMCRIQKPQRLGRLRLKSLANFECVHVVVVDVIKRRVPRFGLSGKDTDGSQYLDLRIGPMRQQRPYETNVAPVHRIVQRCLALFILAVDRNPGFDHFQDSIGVPFCRVVEQVLRNAVKIRKDARLVYSVSLSEDAASDEKTGPPPVLTLACKRMRSKRIQLEENFNLRITYLGRSCIR